MAVSQVVEHLDEEPWVDQCVSFVTMGCRHEHPRVRHDAFQAIGQLAYDQQPYVQENHHEVLLPLLLAGMSDENIRVAANAINAFTSVADELDEECLLPLLEDFLTTLFARLKEGKTIAIREQ